MESQKGMNDINKNFTEEDEVDFINLEEDEEVSDDRIFKDIEDVLEEDEVEEEKLQVGRAGFNCISPASPLFKFLHGKKKGFKDTFVHNTEKSGTIVYDVEIIDIEF